MVFKVYATEQIVPVWQKEIFRYEKLWPGISDTLLMGHNWRDRKKGVNSLIFI